MPIIKEVFINSDTYPDPSYTSEWINLESSSYTIYTVFCDQNCDVNINFAVDDQFQIIDTSTVTLVGGNTEELVNLTKTKFAQFTVTNISSSPCILRLQAFFWQRSAGIGLFENVGSGARILIAPNRFRTLISSDTSITITENAEEIDLQVVAPPITTLTSAGGTYSLVNDGVGPTLANKGINAGSGIVIDNSDTTVLEISTLGGGEATASTTIYVNAGSGNDANDGLSSLTAVATIQKGLDILGTYLTEEGIIQLEGNTPFNLGNNPTLNFFPATSFSGNIKILGTRIDEVTDTVLSIPSPSGIGPFDTWTVVNGTAGGYVSSDYSTHFIQNTTNDRFYTVLDNSAGSVDTITGNDAPNGKGDAWTAGDSFTLFKAGSIIQFSGNLTILNPSNTTTIFEAIWVQPATGGSWRNINLPVTTFRGCRLDVDSERAYVGSMIIEGCYSKNVNPLVETLFCPAEQKACRSCDSFWLDGPSIVYSDTCSAIFLNCTNSVQENTFSFNILIESGEFQGYSIMVSESLSHSLILVNQASIYSLENIDLTNRTGVTFPPLLLDAGNDGPSVGFIRNAKLTNLSNQQNNTCVTLGFGGKMNFREQLIISSTGGCITALGGGTFTMLLSVCEISTTGVVGLIGLDNGSELSLRLNSGSQVHNFTGTAISNNLIGVINGSKFIINNVSDKSVNFTGVNNSLFSIGTGSSVILNNPIVPGVFTFTNARAGGTIVTAGNNSSYIEDTTTGTTTYLTNGGTTIDLNTGSCATLGLPLSDAGGGLLISCGNTNIAGPGPYNVSVNDFDTIPPQNCSITFETSPAGIPPTPVTLTSAGGTYSLVNDGTGPTLANKGLSEGTNITITDNGTDLTIAGGVSGLWGNTYVSPDPDVNSYWISPLAAPTTGGVPSIIQDPSQLTESSPTGVECVNSIIASSRGISFTRIQRDMTVLSSLNCTFRAERVSQRTMIGCDGCEMIQGGAEGGGQRDVMIGCGATSTDGSSGILIGCQNFDFNPGPGAVRSVFLRCLNGNNAGGAFDGIAMQLQNCIINPSFQLRNTLVRGRFLSITSSNNPHSGSAVIAGFGGNGANRLTPTAANQYSSRFVGGYRLFTNDSLTSGAVMGPGDGGWSPVCDVNKKENLIELNYTDILSKVDALPVYCFNYIDCPQENYHFSPTAQDWHAQFPCNTIPKPVWDDALSQAAYDEWYASLTEEERESGNAIGQPENVQAVDPDTGLPLFEDVPAKNPLVIDSQDLTGVLLASIKELKRYNDEYRTILQRIKDKDLPQLSDVFDGMTCVV